MITNDCRAAARFIADVWAHERKRLHRGPRPDECVIAAHALATQIVDSFVGDRIAFLGGPRMARNAFATLASGRAKPSAQLADQAEAALRYLDRAGDLATARKESVAHAEHFRRCQEINDSEVGRRVKLSHTQCRDRRISRSLRILKRLHDDCPDIWSAKLRPIADQLTTPLPDQMAA
jgi:hypothetical protein